MDNVVRLHPRALPHVGRSRGISFGQILRVIDGLPGHIISCSDRISGADLIVALEALDDASRRIRVLAECCSGRGS